MAVIETALKYLLVAAVLKWDKVAILNGYLRQLFEYPCSSIISLYLRTNRDEGGLSLRYLFWYRPTRPSEE